jgi:primase-polymerase (primpol)-like protein
MKPEQRAEVAQFYQAYAQELQESFQNGLFHELRRYPHFVVWKTQEIDGKPHKPPYSPIYHRLADTANPASWGTADQALKALRTGSYNGIGFVFSQNDPYAGMDFDHCVGTNRSINKRERDTLDVLSTHTHYSPRDGVHLLFEIDKKRFPGQNRKAGNVEFFKSNQYLTITHRLVANTPETIEKRHVEASYIYLTLFPKEPEQDRNITDRKTATLLWTPAVSDAVPVSEHTEHGGMSGVETCLLNCSHKRETTEGYVSF